MIYDEKPVFADVKDGKIVIGYVEKGQKFSVTLSPATDARAALARLIEARPVLETKFRAAVGSVS